MFQPSTLHTDFARQIHQDRRADIRIDRSARRGGDRAAAGSWLTAVVRHLRHTVPQSADAPATAR